MTLQDAGWRARLSHDLALRLASGVVLAAIALFLTWWGAWPFAVLVTAVGLLMAWEWGRVVRDGENDAQLIVHAGGLLLAACLSAIGLPAFGMIALLIAAIVIAMQSMGSSALLSTAGVFYVGMPVISLVWLRGDALFGLSAVMLVLMTVWATDTGAYFAGRMIGGPRLWPRVSPNKTWSGLLGGVSAAGLVAAGLAYFMSGGLPIVRSAVLGVMLGLASQAGDLAESALKRERGIKDASGLIPGHGGFMDRVDGLVVAATLAAAIALLTNPNVPARAFLFGN